MCSRMGALCSRAPATRCSPAAISSRLTSACRTHGKLDGTMTEPAYEALVRRNRELEALNAVSATIGRGADLETTAGDALDVVLGLTGMRVGCIFRKEPTADELVLVAHRGLQATDAALLGVRPLHGTQVGDAVRTGRVDIALLDSPPSGSAALREMAA